MSRTLRLWIAALSFFLCPNIKAQTDARSSFEVADVKMNQSGEARMAVDFQPGSKFVARNVPMRILIALAYHVRPEAVNGPGWIGSARYDIVAKASHGVTPAELQAMVQTLLAERFKLALHVERKESAAYALEVSKTGPKLQPSESVPINEQRCVPGTGDANQKHYVCAHMTMPLLAGSLQEIAPRDIDVPIVDQTGLVGNFDFKLDWTPAPPSAAPLSDTIAGPSLFEAVENQLGMKLRRTKLPLPVIVVDSVEKTPIEN